MAREADFIIDCSSYSGSITKIIDALNKIGWNYSKDGQIEYLPLNDNDCFDWQKDSLSTEELFSIIDQKQEQNELCGVVLYHKTTDRGITMLVRNTKEIMLNIDVNRKTIYQEFTDVSWYIEMIFAKLKDISCNVESIKFNEIIG